jgi:hypothetical protein
MGWMLNATPLPLYLRERAGTHCIGGWEGRKEILERCGKSRPQPGFDPQNIQFIESRYTDQAIAAHTKDGSHVNKYFNFYYFDVFYMFRSRGFIFRKMVVYTVMVRNVLHASVRAVQYGEECVRHDYRTVQYATIIVYTTVCLKVNPQFRKTYKTSKTEN